MSPPAPDESPPPSTAPLATPPLCIADDTSFWPWKKWPDFVGGTDKNSTLVVVPLCGMADWGLGHALDIEELLALSILEDATARVTADSGFRLLTLPPLRFVAGPAAECAFAADAPLAHRFIAEIVASIAASGFTRVVLYNANPWNEELAETAARDLRIERGLQMFCVNLSGLGFDLHPTRGKTRRAAQTLATWLSGTAPEEQPGPDAPAPPPSVPPWPEAETVYPLADPPASLAEAQALGPAMLDAAGAHLRRLLGEIAARAPLAHGGAIRAMAP
jgi:creatinine amidohydrolase